MNDNLVAAILITVVLIVSMFSVLGISSTIYERGYKNGQIDYANGKIVYHLEKQADNTTIWSKEK